MSIKNKYCLLSELNQDQIDKLVELMPDTAYFDFDRGEGLIGFDLKGDAGAWVKKESRTRITYKEMLSLLGEEEEQLVPHVHQKEIIAWANGEEIEFQSSVDLKWYDKDSDVDWEENFKFRVKPKLTPTQLRIQEVVAELQKLHEQDAVERGVGLVMGRVGCQLLGD
jgi:hypothetical protein